MFKKVLEYYKGYRESFRLNLFGERNSYKYYGSLPGIFIYSVVIIGLGYYAIDLLFKMDTLDHDFY